MGSAVTFYDYINDSDENEISQWFSSVGGNEKVRKTIKGRFKNTLLHLEADYPTNWKRPYVDTLRAPCEGLFEIRHEINHIQYRLIGFHGPGERTSTLVFGAKEISDRFEPRNTCDIAQQRKALVESNPAKYRREHDYS